MSKDWGHIYETIKNVHNNLLSKRSAMVKLNVSKRQLQRYLKAYRTQGKSWFKHKNSGKIPTNKISDEIRNKIVTLWLNNGYKNWDVIHFKYELFEKYDIKISSNSIRRILFENLLISKYSTKSTKRKLKKLVDEFHNKKEITKEIIEQLDEYNPVTNKSEQHSRLEQPKYYGEEVQMDASELVWFGNQKCTLHIAVDRKDGVFLSGWFDRQETLEGYFKMSYIMFNEYGKPIRVVSDNRGVFTNLKVSAEEKNLKLTNYGYALKNLGIELLITSVAQKKGSVERAQRTLQRWLPPELDKLNIKTIDEANKVIPSLLKKLNDYYKKHIIKNLSAYTPLSTSEDLNLILCCRFIRTGDNGGCVHFDNNYYQLYNGNKIVPIKGSKVLIMKALDGKMFGNVGGFSFPMVKGLSRWDKKLNKRIYPEGFENIKKWSPPNDHPYKIKSYLQYLSGIKLKNIVFY